MKKLKMVERKIKNSIVYFFVMAIYIVLTFIPIFSFAVPDIEFQDLVIATTSQYKGIDYSVLEVYEFGKVHAQDAVLTFETVEELKNSTDIRLKNNKYVRTKGYYESSDLGGASYLISTKAESSGSIQLSNGLFANLIPDTYTDEEQVNWILLSITQFGARADGKTESQDSINEAFSFIDSYSSKDRAILYIPKGEYKASNQIQANTSNVNFVGCGENSIIFTDNDYRKNNAYDEPFFASWNTENNFFGYFKLEARENDINKYMRQMCLYYCENLYIYKVNFYIPEEAWSGKYYEDKQYTNLTIYSGDKKVTVDDCIMYQMSGTYRGANIGIMDFWKAGTEDITIMNCELHDNARDEQIGIFSLTGKPESYIKNVDFVNNKVYSYTTPYKEIHGWRTMCFTVAYGDNNVTDINISNNTFESEADSKFMTFGSVRNCRIENNKFTIKSSHGNMGYVFDSSATNNEDVMINQNEFYLTYKNSSVEGKSISAGNLTFTNNRVVSDSTIYKIADRLGVYKNNNFITLIPIGSCGSAVTFNQNTLTAYAGHSNFYSEIMFQLNEGNENTNIEYIGNQITDYTYYYGSKRSKVYDRLSSINGVTLNSLNFSNNTYNCPNYRYTDSSDYIYASWYRSANIKNFIYQNNDFQGVKGIFSYSSDDSKNTTREFTGVKNENLISSIEILEQGRKVKEITTTDATINLSTLVNVVDQLDAEGNTLSEKIATDKEIDWISNFESTATVQNGVVQRHQYGDVKIFATSKDGSGVYGEVIIHFIRDFATDIQIEQDEISMPIGNSHKVMYKVLPYRMVDQTLTWTSENEEIAKVSNTGDITALAKGETYILCKTVDGSEITRKIKVTVREIEVTKIVLSDTYDYYENPGVFKQLTVEKYLPENASNQGISQWRSSNESVATVDQNGLVTVIGRGACAIYAYSLNGERYGVYNLYVKPEIVQNMTVSTTKTYALIQWNSLGNIDGYNIYRKQKNDKEWTKVASQIKKDQVLYYDMNLTPNTEYQYYITSYITGWDTDSRVEYESDPSEIITKKTNATEVITSLDPRIDNLSIPIGYMEKITMYYTPKNAEFMGLDWEIEDTNIVTLQDDSTTETATLKAQNIGYTKLKVTSKDSYGASVTIPIGVTPNYKVTNINLTNDYNDVEIRWQGIPEEEQIDGYIIARTNTMVYRDIQTISLNELQTVKNERGEEFYTYTDIDLSFGLTYRYRITPYILHEGLIYPCLGSTDQYITIPEYVPIDSILTEEEYILNVNEIKQIEAKSNTENSSSNQFVWYSKNENIVSVTKIGFNQAEIKGLSTGITRIEVVADDEDCKYVASKVIVLPTKVLNVSSRNVSLSELTIVWDRVSGASGYVIYRYNEDTSKWEEIARTENYLYNDRNLTENKQYRYKVVAYLEDGKTSYEGESSEEITVKTLEKFIGNQEENNTNQENPIQPSVTKEPSNNQNKNENINYGISNSSTSNYTSNRPSSTPSYITEKIEETTNDNQDNLEKQEQSENVQTSKQESKNKGNNTYIILLILIILFGIIVIIF